MKQRLRVMLAVAMFMTACALTAAMGAAPLPQDADEKPQMALAYIEHVKPSMMMEYEAAKREMNAMLAEVGADVQYMMISGPEMGYAHILMLPDGFNSMDPLREQWMKHIEAIGMERWMEVSAKADACVDRTAMIHAVYREDMSYIPEDPDITDTEVQFAQYHYIYVLPGAEQKMAEAAQKFKELYAEHGIRRGWNVYEHITGEDLPLFMVVEVGRDEAELAATIKKTQETLGEAGMELGYEAGKIFRKTKIMNGYPRFDLSYPAMDIE